MTKGEAHKCLLVAAEAIGQQAPLLAADRVFEEIAAVSSLKLTA